jgi:mRNA interferase YafQ
MNKYQIQIENSFEKDLKRLKKRGKDLSKLKVVLELLEKGDFLPEKYKNHPLKGNFKGYYDCHVEPDWLLIYKKK